MSKGKTRMFYLKKTTDTNVFGKGEKETFVYKPKDETEKDVTLSITGEATARMLGLPTESPGDTVAIEFGVINKQAKLLMEQENKKNDEQKDTQQPGDDL